MWGPGEPGGGKQAAGTRKRSEARGAGAARGL
jgi:hypothetical protein